MTIYYLHNQHLLHNCAINVGYVSTIFHLSVSHRLSVNVTQVKQVTNVCLLIKSRLVYSPRDKHTSDECDNQSHSIRPMTKYTSRGNAITISTPNFASVHAYICLPNKPVVGTMWQLFVWLIVQCTIIGAFVKYTRRGNTP